jgi:hypothetical protein
MQINVALRQAKGARTAILGRYAHPFDPTSALSDFCFRKCRHSRVHLQQMT